MGSECYLRCTYCPDMNVVDLCNSFKPSQVFPHFVKDHSLWYSIH